MRPSLANSNTARHATHLRNDRQVLAVERTYRQGVYVILDPTPEELDVAREGDLWKLWNSERAKDPFAIRQADGS